MNKRTGKYLPRPLRVFLTSKHRAPSPSLPIKRNENDAFPTPTPTPQPALLPFSPHIYLAREPLQWKSTQRALTLQAAFCLCVIHTHLIIPGILVTLGMCTLSNKKENASAAGGVEGEGVQEKNTKTNQQKTSYKALAKATVDVAWLQRSLENLAVQLEHATAVTMWEDPIVTTAFIAACGGDSASPVSFFTRSVFFSPSLSLSVSLFLDATLTVFFFCSFVRF